MFFDTDWTRLSDSQRQGRNKGLNFKRLRPTAYLHSNIGPMRIRVKNEEREVSLYVRERGYYERKDQEWVSYSTIKFIKVNGKEIF
jgi:hypothetical protein